jgi:hypothetical protein|nr:MAG TPA: metallophosphatase domain protein [Caudoviricetes sp.]
MEIYFTSDLHLGHDNIIRFCNRPFSSVEEMNDRIIQNYNSIVHKNDLVYILGDLTYKISVKESNNLIQQLKGRKVLIRGNHDLKYDSSLFEDILDYKEFNQDKVKYVLMHYPLMSWNGSYKNKSIHLHGHIHAQYVYNLKNRHDFVLRYDVGVDANNYYPVSLTSIRDFFKVQLEYSEGD